ncbi:hypothetical protein GCM10017668_33920 [Streptomyces tuirus]|uniref:Uncharacterized protein n=1 Tax=Streptomyces tuirus TaxID=68278 RepID=A0A7G1NFE0_9ACTN|nr:hypothetical protein GCM10017668_33920 [Streptomyces tuirus]
MRSQATYVLVRAVCSRSSASLGLPVSERAVRSSTGWRALTYDENDGYGRVCAAGPAAFEALVQTSVVMAQRYEREPGERIGRRSRSGVPLRLYG